MEGVFDSGIPPARFFAMPDRIQSAGPGKITCRAEQKWVKYPTVPCRTISLISYPHYTAIDYSSLLNLLKKRTNAFYKHEKHIYILNLFWTNTTSKIFLRDLNLVKETCGKSVSFHHASEWRRHIATTAICLQISSYTSDWRKREAIPLNNRP